ncbi:hypothetical protein [Myxococcus qinghaiensis]|nr:hypothetical protein [Myxococcus qinghaiensis]MCP3169061.1 hypothetical protein [Myxococcus qinghaiensis]
MSQSTRWLVAGVVGALLVAGGAAFLWARAAVKRSPSIIHPDEEGPRR